MGIDEQEDDENGEIVITEEAILHEAGNKGLKIREAPDGTSWEVSRGKRRAFFPKAFSRGGYTERQLAMIEAAFEDCGIDLFPLGKRVH